VAFVAAVFLVQLLGLVACNGKSLLLQVLPAGLFQNHFATGVADELHYNDDQ